MCSSWVCGRSAAGLPNDGRWSCFACSKSSSSSSSSSSTTTRLARAGFLGVAFFSSCFSSFFSSFWRAPPPKKLRMSAGIVAVKEAEEAGDGVGRRDWRAAGRAVAEWQQRVPGWDSLGSRERHANASIASSVGSRARDHALSTCGLACQPRTSHTLPIPQRELQCRCWTCTAAGVATNHAAAQDSFHEPGRSPEPDDPLRLSAAMYASLTTVTPAPQL